MDNIGEDKKAMVTGLDEEVNLESLPQSKNEESKVTYKSFRYVFTIGTHIEP